MVAGAAAAPAACVVVLIAAGRRLPLHAAQPGTTLKILQKKRWPARKLKVQAPIAAPSFWSSSRKSSRERRKGSRRSIAVRSQTSQTEENGENGSHRSGDRESAGSSPPLSSCLYLRRTVRAGELLEYQGTVVVSLCSSTSLQFLVPEHCQQACACRRQTIAEKNCAILMDS